MDMLVTRDHRLHWQGHSYRCALGKGGIRATKTEGDGATPMGRFALRRVLYRADRLDAPKTGLAQVAALDPADGWCDDPADTSYNRQVRHPYPASAETLWRDDGLYDVIVVLGHNDDPPVAGAGSAIFLHVARPDYGPTEGCVALALPDLLKVLEDCGDGTFLSVTI
jgi:L,D-peptidoglycan transpeptidase YkuD (ErfK/YbiS/YcfS/YnhG family)